MVDVFKIKKGDTIKFRNSEVHIVTEAITKKTPKSVFFIELWVEKHGDKRSFTYGDNGGSYYSNGTQAGWDIVEHIPKQVEKKEDKMKKVTALGHQLRQSFLGDKRPDPSVGSAAVKPTQDDEHVVDVSKFRVGDDVVFRNETTATVEDIYYYDKRGDFGLKLSGFIDRLVYCGANGRQFRFWPDEFDIVKHIPNQVEEYEPSAEWMAKWAYPDGTIWGRKDEEPAQDEMTMRDQFAIAIMSGTVARSYVCNEDLAEFAYDLADEMMKARERNIK